MKPDFWTVLSVRLLTHWPAESKVARHGLLKHCVERVRKRLLPILCIAFPSIRLLGFFALIRYMQLFGEIFWAYYTQFLLDSLRTHEAFECGKVHVHRRLNILWRGFSPYFEMPRLALLHDWGSLP